MERLYIDLKNQITERMADAVRMVDEDCGQIEAAQQGEDQYPIDTPCVLIGTPEVEWQDLTGGDTAQKGRASFTVRLVFDRYDDTHAGAAGAEEAAEGRIRLARQLNGFIHGWVFDGCASGCRRSYSRGFAIGPYKVYETTYRTTVEG